MQEFLASYAVEVDGDGLNRLREALEGNRELAEAAASAFAHAKESMDQLLDGDGGGLNELIPSEGKELPLKPVLELTGAENAMNDFKARMEALRPALKVNTTGIRSAVSSAISSVRSMLASVSVTIPVRAVAKLDSSGLKTGTGAGTGTGSGTNSGAGSSTGTTPLTGALSPLSVPAYGEGGKVKNPTLAMIAEEGKPEYVIPTDNEDRAVPLLKQVLKELSDSTRAAVWEETKNPADALRLPEGEWEEKKPLFPAAPIPLRTDIGSLSADLRDLTAAARGAILPQSVKAGDSYHTVEAPINIRVSPGSASPEEVGKSIYDMAQRQLLKTIRGVFS